MDAEEAAKRVYQKEGIFSRCLVLFTLEHKGTSSINGTLGLFSLACMGSSYIKKKYNNEFVILYDN